MPNPLIQELYHPEKPIHTNQQVLLEKGRKLFPNIPTFFGLFKSPIGIEIEVENAFPLTKEYVYWSFTEDGSLKIAGVEYISVPVAGHNIDFALEEIRQVLDKFTPLWSHRTSIHVHTYVGKFTEEQLNLLVAVYAALESLFFSMVNEVRRANPYCYHVRDCSPNEFPIGDNNTKYCALNIGSSLRAYNTAEFRHMEGTGNFKQIKRWIQLVVKLHKYILTTDPSIVRRDLLALNTNSEYKFYVQRIFGATAELFEGKDLKSHMEEGVLWGKLHLSGI